MAFNFKTFWKGIKIFPKTTTSSEALGDLEVLDSNSKLHFHDGVTNSPVVTEEHAATLTNKSIDADTNTITNIEDADIKLLAGINASKIANGNVDNIEFQYLDGVTSSIQDQLDLIVYKDAITASTGLLTGGILTIDADPTKFDLSAGSGRIVDYDTDPGTPTIIDVSWAAFDAQTVEIKKPPENPGAKSVNLLSEIKQRLRYP